MFTGIVEHRGAVSSVDHEHGRARIEIDVGPLDDLDVGDSIAVNGVCLTVTQVAGTTATFDVVEETLHRSNLGALERGDPVNLERAMPAAGRFDGHVVQGHVDAVGRVVSLGEARSRMTIEPPRTLMRYLVEKGSVTVDGVSLTVAGITDSTIDVALIPHTLAETTLGLRNVEDTVNLEVDVLAKYVERLLEST